MECARQNLYTKTIFCTFDLQNCGKLQRLFILKSNKKHVVTTNY